MYPLPGWFVDEGDPKPEPKVEAKVEEQGKTPGSRPGEGFSQLLPIIAIFVMIIFILWLPRRREQREREALMNSMKKGDKVLTHGGILGTVHAVEDKEDEVTVEVAPGIRIKLVKAGIIRNYTNEETARKPAGGETKKS